MDSQSPLRFLDYDVTQYIYKTYYPTKEARILKKKMNEQFLGMVNTYLSKYLLKNIYEYEVMFCIRGYLYKKISFLSFLKNNDSHKDKIKLPYLFHCTKPRSYFRANQYKNEAILLRKLVNIVQ